MAVAVARHRFTVDDFERMASAGVFGHEARVELINGEVVDMTPIGWRHMARHTRLVALFNGRFGERAIVVGQGSIRLAPDSWPQPDILVLRPRMDYYEQGGPAAGDVLLLVEIADTSLPFDRTEKMRLYARAGIAEYWILDVDGRALEVCRHPAPDGYRDIRRVSSGAVALLAFPDERFDVADIVG